MPSPNQNPDPKSAISRFTITVSRARRARVEVRDRQNDRTLFEWSGSIASHLIESGALPPQTAPVDTHFGDKGFVQHLSLLAASAELASPDPAEAAAEGRGREQRSTRPARMRWSRLSARLRRLGASLGRDDMTVAKLLFSKPGQHFSTDDVSCLLELRDRPLPSDRVKSALDRLTALAVIQRIDVAPGRIFYDIDTRPHLHLYDETTGELHDAEVDGVIGYAEDKPSAELRIMDGNRVQILPPA